MRRLIAFLLLSSPAVLFAQQQQQGGVIIPNISLQDQFSTQHDVKDHRGHVVVLIYGDKASAKANSELGSRLHVHYHPSAKGQPPEKARNAPVKPVPNAPPEAKNPDVFTVAIACHNTKINAAQLMMRGLIRNGSPEMPVWLDFNDTMKSQFPFRDGVPNVVVIDAQGRYRYAAGGQPTNEGVERLFAVVDQLRQEAVEGR